MDVLIDIINQTIIKLKQNSMGWVSVEMLCEVTDSEK